MGEGLGRERSCPPFPLRFTPATQAIMRLTSFKQIVQWKQKGRGHSTFVCHRNKKKKIKK